MDGLDPHFLGAVVETVDELGKLHPTTVKRFHDGYEAHGFGASLGVLDHPWADRLTLSAFQRASERELQHNLRMTVPYGDVTLGNSAVGAGLHYAFGDHHPSPLDAELVLNYALRRRHFTDVSRHIWDWNGDITGTRASPGERSRGSRVRSTAHDVTGRLNLGWRLNANNRFEMSTLATLNSEARYTIRAVEADVPTRRIDYDLLKVVSGLSWQLQVWDDRLENDLFTKLFHTRPDGPVSGSPTGDEEFALEQTEFGFGDALRFSPLDALHLKASYEYAVRVPDPEELFGNGGQIEENTGLLSERSHNLNLGLVFEPTEDSLLSQWSASTHLFFRRTTDLIFLTVVLDSARYENISDVDTPGVEAEIAWDGWGIVQLGGNVTWLNPTNESTGGYFGRFKDERIPNIPWLMANLNAAVNLRWSNASVDRLRLYWYGHYAHEYYLFWENEGIKSTKAKVPTYFTQDAGLSCRFTQEWMVANVEVKNVTDAKTFDNVGVQLPGRSYHLKLSLGL